MAAAAPQSEKLNGHKACRENRDEPLAGGAAKEQVQAMLRVLLPGAKVTGADAADALAVAICLANHRPR